MKAPKFYHEKPFPTRTPGDVIRARRTAARLTRRQLSAATSVPLYWPGRWERDRALPNQAQWNSLGKSFETSGDAGLVVFIKKPNQHRTEPAFTSQLNDPNSGVSAGNNLRR
jgi:hypothetical protein